MIQFFHKYQKSVVVYLMVLAILFSMTFFGVNMLGSGPGGNYALKINDEEVSYQDIAERRQTFEAQLRQQFGNAFDTLWEYLSRDLNQRIVDSFIEEKLLDEVTERQALGASNPEIKDALLKMFQGQFSPDLYRAYLNQRRLTAAEFEQQLAQQIKREQLNNIIGDLAVASSYEAIHIGQREEGKIDLNFVKFSPDQFIAEVKEPDNQILQEYFEENLSRYELEPRVKYSAIKVAPEDVWSEVPINDEDVELYYAEHMNEFKRPARVKAAHIQINYTADSSPDAINAVRKKAEDIREQALRGADFSNLVVQYSDDLPTKLVNGSLGWIEEGKRDDAVAKAALTLKKEGVADLVSTDYGFHIVKVLEYQEPGSRELGDVRDEIVKKLKQLDAPSVALVKAEDILNRFNSSRMTLVEFAEKENLKVFTTDKLLTAEQDLNDNIKGLTSQVLENPDAPQIFEIGDISYVVSIIEHKGTELPEFAAIKDQVKKDWLAKSAKELAEKKAKELFATAQEANDLVAAAKAQGLMVEKLKDVSASKAGESVLSNAELRTLAFRRGTPGIVGDQVYKVSDDFVVAAVAAIDRPAKDKLTTGLSEYRDRVTQNNTQAVRSSLLKALQVKSDIEITPGVMAN